MSKLTPEIKEYILDNYNDFTYKELSNKINCAYNRSVSVDQIGRVLKKQGIKKSHNPAWFKGENKTPLGSELVDRDGITQVKVCEHPKYNIRYKPKHRILWEQYHNSECKQGEIIIFADGDRNNFSVDNLVKVGRKNLAYINKHGLYGYNKELVETGKLLSELEYTLNRI